MRSLSVRCILLLLLFSGCRQEVVEELEKYGVQREWIPFAGGSVVDKNYNQTFIEGAYPWLATQVIARPYSVALSSEARSGKKALKIETKVVDAGRMWIMRYEDLSDLLGKKIRFTGHVKPLDWKGTIEAGYMSDKEVDEIKKISFTEPLKQDQWSSFSTEIDIPITTQYLTLVLQVEGTGSILIDDCAIEVIGISVAGPAPRDVKTAHVNLGFEDGGITPRKDNGIIDSLLFRMPFWRTDYRPEEYKLLLDSTRPHLGKYSGGFTAKVDRPRSSAMLIREFEIELVRGHRVRFDAWIRSKDLQGLATLESVWRGAKSFGAEVKRLWDVHGTAEWKQFSIEMDVPIEATDLRIDIGYNGQGTLLVDDLSFERLEKLPGTNNQVDKSEYFAKPLNLGFEDQ